MQCSCSTGFRRAAAIEVSFVPNLPQQILQGDFKPVPEAARQKFSSSSEDQRAARELSAQRTLPLVE